MTVGREVEIVGKAMQEQIKVTPMTETIEERNCRHICKHGE